MTRTKHRTLIVVCVCLFAGEASSGTVVARVTLTAADFRTSKVAYNGTTFRNYLGEAIYQAESRGAASVQIYANHEGPDIQNMAGMAERFGVARSRIDISYAPVSQTEINVRALDGASLGYRPFLHPWHEYPVVNENAFDPTNGSSMRNALSHMASNRRDLVRGRGTRYSYGERAAEIVSRYRSGVKTQTPTQTPAQSGQTGSVTKTDAQQ